MSHKYYGHPAICKCGRIIGFFNFCTACGVKLVMDDLTPIKVTKEIAITLRRYNYSQDSIKYEITEWTKTNYDGPAGCDHDKI